MPGVRRQATAPPKKIFFSTEYLPPRPPLAISRVSAQQSPGLGGGGRSPSDGLPLGGGGGCKGTGSLSEVFSKIGSSHSQNWSSTSGV